MAKPIAAEAAPTDIGILRAGWAAPPNVHAFITLRNGPGVSPAPFDRINMGLRSGDDPALVQENRRRLVEQYSLPSTPAWLQQVHGVAVARAGAGFVGEPVADACVSDTAGRVLAVLTADCLPVVFCNRQGSEVAVAHAGWRSLVGGVLEATVATMQSPAAQLLAWMGPAAGPAHYEVGIEVREAFLGADAAAETAFRPTRPGHWLVDLYALARLRLLRAGLAAAQVGGGGLCTIGDPQRFYSHRREGRTGRMATLAWFD